MRNSIFSAVALATASAVALGVSAPVSAQVKQAIAVVNIDQAIGQSSAATTASQQMQVTYKANIDQLNTRRTALQTEIQQKQTALQTAAQAAGQNPPAATQTNLQTQYNELQRRAQEAQAELQQLEQPLQLARAYVLEQIGAKLPEAMRNVMTKNKIDLLVKAEAAEAFQPSADVTRLLVQEINALVPSVSITPPQGWQPGGQGQQQGAAPAATTPPAGEGR
ncbi:MAG: OmpH family outer membrane protein [Alphaproteobacteria bacterium]|jgi:Outer membrane protein|nr:OmpH family outer membrane protein [Alphaproteobacteria bacterium]MBU0877551.1 OmpH family outer membrane protein [Alphaproteobacteria bacterium]MBU1768116.1 OmpH family outer membrane protein [Alphaproteobacteria bacterium]